MRDGLLRLMALNKGRGYVAVETTAEKAVIYLYDFIAGTDEEAAFWGGVGPGDFARQLAEVGDRAVELRVNSPGGSVFGGRAMAAALAGHPGEVTAVVDGLAASAASFLVQAADRVEMSEGAMFMIHNAWTLALGNAAAMRAEADILDKIDGEIARTYAAAAARRGVTDAPDFAALMASETWMTSAEAVAAGLADGMAERPKEKKAAVKWDMSAFANAPQPAAASEPETEPEPEPEAPVVEAPEAEVEAGEVADFTNEIERRRRMARAYALTPA